MSEQPTSAYNPNNYHPPVPDGSVVMDHTTDVQFHASELPYEKTPERPRELTESERLAYEIRMAGSKLHDLNEERERRLAA